MWYFSGAQLIFQGRRGSKGQRTGFYRILVRIGIVIIKLVWWNTFVIKGADFFVVL